MFYKYKNKEAPPISGPLYMGLGTCHSHPYNQEKKLNNMKISNFSLIHQRTKIPGKIAPLKTGEIDEWIQESQLTEV